MNQTFSDESRLSITSSNLFLQFFSLSSCI